MDLIFSLIVECLIDLITGEAADAAAGSERTKGWSKPAKVILIIAAFLIITAMIGALVIFEIMNLSDGETMPGVILLGAAAVLLIYTVVSIIVAYRKNRRKQ